jgi:hypothetical protein
MLIDSKEGSLILCYARSRQIVRSSQRVQYSEIFTDNLYCTGLALDIKKSCNS